MIDKTSCETAAATVTVALGNRSYPIFIGSGLLSSASELLSKILPGARFAIVADEAVSSHAALLANSLKQDALLLGEPIKVPSGESSKSFASLERVSCALLDLGLERSHAVIAVGGGVIGDLAGFAAAILKRGIKLIQAPTTLLAQVDSSVGGKTGINTRHGKNLIGAFHQPSAVLADLDTLETLPPREFRSGYAEVVKYGLLGNRDFFQWLETHEAEIFAHERDALTFAIRTSCEMKADIVARDEFEMADRALLNLGHTFGHAVEAWGGYSGAILHGEAVALGMMLAAEFSEKRGLCPADDVARMRRHLGGCGFAIDFAGLKRQTGDRPSTAQLLRFMEQDKKVRSGEMTLILLRGIGEAFVARDVSRDEIGEFLAQRLAG